MVGGNAFNFDLNSRTCFPKLCPSSSSIHAHLDPQLVINSRTERRVEYETYVLIPSKPILTLYELESDCPAGETRVYLVRNESDCVYRSPCPAEGSSIKLVLGLLPFPVLYNSEHRCVPLNTSSAYWARGPLHITRGALCANDTRSCATAPEQIHMSLGSEKGSMVIEWATPGPVQPVIKYAKSMNDLLLGSEGEGQALSVPARSTTSYTVCGQDCKDQYNEAYCSPQLHWGVIGGLDSGKGGQQYYYTVGDASGEFGEEKGFSDIKSFRTVPSARAREYPLHIAIIGDIGQTVHSEATCYELRNDTSIELGIIVGDLSYADGYGPRWDSWGRMVEKCFSEIPWLVLPGNHEIEFEHDTKQAFKAYRHRFHMPSSSSSSSTSSSSSSSQYDDDDMQQQHSDSYRYKYVRQPTYHQFGNTQYDYGSSYYSVDVGTAHFVFLNTYTDSHIGSKQYLWLIGDLDAAAAKRRQTRRDSSEARTAWIFVFMHAPIYNSNVKHKPSREEPTVEMKNSMEDLFYKYRVNAVFSGHVHAYERFHRTYKGKRVDDAPFYITIGDAGNREKLYDQWPYLEPFSAFRNALFYGSGRLSLINDSMALWEWQPNAKNGTWDAFWIQNQNEVEEEEETQPKEDGENSSAVMGITIAASLTFGLFLIIIIVSLGIHKYYRRRRQSSTSTEEENTKDDLSSMAREEGDNDGRSVAQIEMYESVPLDSGIFLGIEEEELEAIDA